MTKKLSCIAIFLLLFFMIFIIFVMSKKVYAIEKHKLFYFKIKNNQPYLTYEHINFYGDFSKPQVAFIIFDNLFSTKKIFIPCDTHLISVQIKNQILILNLSNQIKNYGGHYYEKHLLEQIKKNTLELGLKNFKILIENQKDLLPEGIIYN